MATINQPDDQQNPNQQGQQPTTGGSGGAGASGGQGQGGAAAPVSPVQQNQAPQQNQGYTDVGSYIDANQAGSAQLGNQVSSNLTDQYNTAKSGIDTSANGLINSVNQGTVKSNTDLINQVGANPTAVASDPNQLSQFQSQLNAQYGGPTSWGDYGTQQGKVAQAQQTAGLVNQPGGLNVLTQQVEQPGAPQGVNQLDTMLLGGSPGAMQQIQQAASPYSDLNSYLDQQNVASNAAIAQGQATTAATQQAAQTGLTGAEGALQTGLTNPYNSAVQQAQTYNQGINTELADLAAANQGIQGFNAANNGTYTTNGTGGPGYNGFMGRFGTELGNIQNPNLQAVGLPTMNQVATPEQFAQAAALGQLSGGKYQSPLNQANAAQAGTWKMPDSAKSFTDITNPYVQDVQGWSQGAGFAPKDMQQLTDYLDSINANGPGTPAPTFK